MKRLIRFVFALLFSSWVVGTYAANVVRPGEYLSKNGQLNVERRNGKMLFRIFSQGANGHICDVYGRLRGTKAEPDEMPHPNCFIRMTASLDGGQVKVASSDGGTCSTECGARATIDDVYQKPKALCTKKNQRNARDLFIHRYRAKQFSEAVQALRPVLEQCAEFRRSEEEDGIRNDLSLAYFHLGKKKQCIDTLQETYGWEIEDEENIEKYVGPGITDSEIWRPILQATWHNRRLCRGMTEVQ